MYSPEVVCSLHNSQNKKNSGHSLLDFASLRLVCVIPRLACVLHLLILLPFVMLDCIHLSIPFCMVKATIPMVSDFSHVSLKDDHLTIFSRCVHDVVSRARTYFTLGISQVWEFVDWQTDNRNSK
jgi:hypothetical protein